MVSLQEQLMKAGLVDKGKVKQANHDKSRQKKAERRAGIETVDESRLAALEAQKKQAERARELNAQRDAAAARKAVQAQIAQLVQQNRQPKVDKAGKGAEEVAYHYTLDNMIERIYVSPRVRDQLVAGRLVIVAQDGKAELVPKIVADKIAERDPGIVVRVSQPTAAPEEDDPYADYKIPDDFTW